MENGELDWFTISKIRSLSKKRRREKRMKTEDKFTVHSFDEQYNELKAKHEAAAKQAKIRDLIETIKAKQIIGDDVTDMKMQLAALLKG